MSANRLTFYTSEGRRIETDSLRVVLPDGESFQIDAESGREGAAVLHLDPGTPEQPSLRLFSIEPGAANLISLRVLKAR